MKGSAAALQQAASSFALPLEGLRMLRRERSLWGPAGVPALLSLASVLVALFAVLSFGDEIQARIAARLPELAVGAWYSWLWVGPARLLFWLLAKLLFLATAMLAVVAAFLVTSVLSAPFHDVLARRVEALVTGRVEEVEVSGLAANLREGGRAVGEELRRLLFLASLLLPLLAVGLLVPGAQLLAGPAITLVTVLFLPLDYAGFTLDRRRLAFREKRRWLREHLPAALGFGSAAFLLCGVPLLNFFAMPVLVVGGTLLALRQPPRVESG